MSAAGETGPGSGLESDYPPGTRGLRVAGRGLHLHAVDAGAGDPPLLLLHGFPDHWRTWRGVLPLLAARHRVLAPDLRGINLSDKPAGVAAYAIDELVADVQALLQGLGGRGVLVGHDWGGMLAWCVAARSPHLVERLVVLNAPHPGRFAQLLRSDGAQQRASAYLGNLRAPAAEARLSANDHAALWAVLAGDVPGLTPTDRADHQRAWSQRGALTASLNWYRALELDADARPTGSSVPALGGVPGPIQVPALILWGERDGALVPANLEGLESLVAKVQVRRFPTLGHWPHLEQPREVAREILRFVDGAAG